jgi:hypothetical protein
VYVRLNAKVAALVEASTLLIEQRPGKIIVMLFTSSRAAVLACDLPT